MQKIGIIGYGHMGRALARGLIKEGVARGEELLICSRAEQTLALAREECGARTTHDAAVAVAQSELLFLCVKKDVFLALAPEIAGAGLKGKTLVSFLAACTIAEHRAVLGADVPLVRAMPTVGIAQGAGIIAYTQTKNAALETLLHVLGFAFETDEAGLERATAYAGCGPGFAAYLLDAYVRAGIALGFEQESAKRIAQMNFSYALGHADYPALMAEVATKGGLTEFGMRRMRECGVDEGIIEGVRATHARILGES